jgi:predicted lipid-binding transport protein (Tim44 family)
MSDSGWIEIIFLAMLAGFIGLRLYNVLGRRTGHEKPVTDAFRPQTPEPARPGVVADREAPPRALPADIEPGVRPGLEAVMRADRSFDPAAFTRGSQAAYTMILEAFWRGDVAAMEGLVADDLLAEFREAIAAREEAGHVLANRMLAVDSARIVEARLNGTMAEVTVRFDADIVTATRDAEGTLISGSETDSVQTHDLWTFSRLTNSTDPNWLLIDTDEA